MLKRLIVLLILSHSILLISCNDDEFAEFDDFIPGQTEQEHIIQYHHQHQHQQQQHQHQQQQPKQSVDIDGISQDEIKLKLKQKTAYESEGGKSDEQEEADKTQKKPDLKLVNVPSIRQLKIESYYIEIAFLLATFLYLVNFYLGSAKNVRFAQEWYDHSRDLLKQQFVLVGGAPTLNDGAQKRDDESEAFLASMKKQKGLIKSSESLFTIWNSGRVGMDGLLVEINLLKRQDLFSMALNLLRVSKDNLILRFLLGQEGYENFVFCVAHKSHASKLVRDMVDINTFCPKRKPTSQYGSDTEKLVVMSELSDVAGFIFDLKTVTFLKKYERSINYIHITDHYSTDRSEDVSPMQKLAVPKRMATFSFSFPRNAEERNEFILFSLSLLDRLRRFKLARDSKQKSEKNRQKIAEYLQKTAFNLRQEAAQAKKEELRRLEKERIYNEDDPEKQRRWERKEAKREQKRNKMRVKQLKVKSM